MGRVMIGLLMLAEVGVLLSRLATLGLIDRRRLEKMI